MYKKAFDNSKPNVLILLGKPASLYNFFYFFRYKLVFKAISGEKPGILRLPIHGFSPENTGFSPENLDQAIKLKIFD